MTLFLMTSSFERIKLYVVVRTDVCHRP